MALSEEILLESVQQLRPVEVKSIWTSATPFIEVCRNDPPDWLFCSCKPARYNPKNVPCVYFAQDGRTARAEHACNEEIELQPIVFFSAAIHLRCCVDLTEPKSLRILGLKQSQLFEDWERKKNSATQALGAIIASQSRFSAIVFPSAAARQAGFRGKNIVIFRDNVRRPDSVKIVGPTKKPLQSWP